MAFFQGKSGGKWLLASLEYCQGCGACQRACPVFAATGNEAFGPAGKAAILRQWAAGFVADDEAAEALKRCVQCGKCASACPAAVPLDKIFAEASARLSRNPLPERARQKLLRASPRLFIALRRPLAFTQAYGAKKRPLSRLARRLGASWPPLARKALSLEKGGKGKVLIFPGCVASHSLPEIAEACAAALKLNGLEAFSPKNLVCCGGWHGPGRLDYKAMLANLRALSRLEFDFLATPCPSCLKTIKNQWSCAPDLSGGLREFASRLASRSFDIHWFLKSQSPRAHAKGVAWHQPCHMEERDSRAARKAAGLEGEDQDCACCGGCLGPFPGGRNQDKPGAALRKAWRNAALNASVQSIATTCPACVLAINEILAADRIVARHSAEIYVENMRKAGA